VPSEFHNLANLAKHAAKSAVRGRFTEAGAAIGVLGWRAVESLQDAGSAPQVSCAFCGWSGRRYRTFLAGTGWRRDAVCPSCLSLERHREFVALFRRLRPLFGPRVRILDIAPTLAFSNLCRASADVDYVSLDRESRLAMLHADVEHLPFAGAVFDFVLCSHVLDYVTDDVGAMREIRQVLKDGGVAILEQTYLTDRPTDEWGGPRHEQLDRIRQYGRDYPDRLREAGLHLRSAGMGSQQVFLAFKTPDDPVVERVAAAVAR
jgi:SAM-dependent methyltransferase